jgi:hypothetical protein
VGSRHDAATSGKHSKQLVVSRSGRDDINVEAERHRDREIERQRDRETERQRDRETERQRDRETERQRDRKTERQIDRETKEIDIQTLCKL